MGRLEIYAMIKIGEVWEYEEGDDLGKAILLYQRLFLAFYKVSITVL